MQFFYFIASKTNHFAVISKLRFLKSLYFWFPCWNLNNYTNLAYENSSFLIEIYSDYVLIATLYVKGLNFRDPG